MTGQNAAYDPSKIKPCGYCCQGGVVVGCPVHGWTETRLPVIPSGDPGASS